MDKTTSYKFVGGKLVARTAEEHAKLVELRNAASHNKPGKAARSKESFIMISQAQQERLDALGLSPCMRLFMALLWEDFRHRGRAFSLLTGKVLEPQAQRRALTRYRLPSIWRLTETTRKSGPRTKRYPRSFIHSDT